ncbi:hypothetical protein F4556_004689 [Kitasatospora gansuensis]|uniref:DUF4239 domain-containing protein n=1 Tax=Kitasatospora gansuensis TaxID=258050 RepID=A0A7W7WJZ0_9ACTN|nr:hypothetical protein [Kitasatospora gansuensis]MBB4949154.1 hypothetical protein [Kitasatospora gansuensis]
MSAADLALLVGPMVLVAFGLYLTHRLVPNGRRMPFNEVGGVLFSMVGVLYAVLLAFVVIVVWENTEAAKATTFKEADALAGVYWLSRQMPLPEGPELERLTLDYAHEVITVEWPMMTRHHSDPASTALIYRIRESALSFQPGEDTRLQGVYQQLVADVEQLASERRARLNQTDDVVPNLLWVALIIGAVVTVGFTFFFGLPNLLVQIVMVVTMTGLMALLLVTIKEMDYPFDGLYGIDPEAFRVFLSRLPPVR